MPIEGKRRLAAAGNAMDDALKAAEAYLSTLDPPRPLRSGLRIQDALSDGPPSPTRRTFELQRETSLRKHADAITLHLFPEGHPQERVLAGIWFLAAWESATATAPASSPASVEEAAGQCPGHMVIRL